jgi:hypothetical protein
MTNQPITAQQLQVLRRLITCFEQQAIRYQVTGGLAGNIYGSTWPLHDIDVDVARTDLPKIVACFAAMIVRPFGRFIDDEFDLYLLSLEIERVQVDISQAEEAYLFSHGKRLPLNIDLSRAQQHDFQGVRLWVQPLDALIAYKEQLGRTADVADLYRLRGHSR